MFCCNKEHAVHSCHLGDTGPPRAGLCNQVLAAHSPAHGGAGGAAQGGPRAALKFPAAAAMAEGTAARPPSLTRRPLGRDQS